MVPCWLWRVVWALPDWLAPVVPDELKHDLSDVYGRHTGDEVGKLNAHDGYLFLW